MEDEGRKDRSQEPEGQGSRIRGFKYYQVKVKGERKEVRSQESGARIKTNERPIKSRIRGSKGSRIQVKVKGKGKN